jgi:hypothetical protein
MAKKPNDAGRGRYELQGYTPDDDPAQAVHDEQLASLSDQTGWPRPGHQGLHGPQADRTGRSWDRPGHTVPTEEKEATVATRIEDGTVEERAEGEWWLGHDAVKLPSGPFSGHFTAMASGTRRVCRDRPRGLHRRPALLP